MAEHKQDDKVHQSTNWILIKTRRTRRIQRVSRRPLRFQHGSRADKNVFIPPSHTKNVRKVINEDFPDEKADQEARSVYYYCDISMVMQMNDGQIYVFELQDLDDKFCNVESVCFVNYDFHYRGTDECLYGCIVPNDRQSPKWKLDCFMVARHIEAHYGITPKELPRSSRQKKQFQNALCRQPVVNVEQLIENTDWSNIHYIKSMKKDNDEVVQKVSVTFGKDGWAFLLCQAFPQANDAQAAPQPPLIPIVVCKKGRNCHCIEWVKIIYIESRRIHVGIACGYENNKWSATAICLDKGDIYNKHRLVGGVKDEKYLNQLNRFNEKLVVQHISILCRQPMVHPTNNQSNYVNRSIPQMNPTNIPDSSGDSCKNSTQQSLAHHASSIRQHIPEQSQNHDDVKEESGDAWMQDIDDVIGPMKYKTDVIGDYIIDEDDDVKQEKDVPFPPNHAGNKYNQTPALSMQIGQVQNGYGRILQRQQLDMQRHVQQQVNNQNGNVYYNPQFQLQQQPMMNSNGQHHANYGMNAGFNDVNQYVANLRGNHARNQSNINNNNSKQNDDNGQGYSGGY